MATQPAPLSSAFRWKAGFLMLLLLLSIPAALYAGHLLGTELMSSLKGQIMVPPGGENTSFSPYGIAHSGQLTPGKQAFRDHETGEHPGEAPFDAPLSEQDTPAPEVLAAAPQIVTEALLAAPVVETPVEPEPAAESTPKPNSIFSLEESAPRKPKQYRINLGTFNAIENAEALVQDLLTHGYDPFIETREPTESDQPVQYRVLIGTFKEAAEAGGVAEELRRLGYNAWLNEKT